MRRRQVSGPLKLKGKALRAYRVKRNAQRKREKQARRSAR
jgi:hypothetical protein